MPELALCAADLPHGDQPMHGNGLRGPRRFMALFTWAVGCGLEGGGGVADVVISHRSGHSGLNHTWPPV